MDKQTKFASPERSSQEKVRSEKDLIAKQKLFAEVLNAFPEIVLILNNNRQISYCNDKLLKLLNVTVDDVLGKRPGEAVGCIRSHIEPAGCGTSLFCRECGAVNSILNAQKGESNYQECRMIIGGSGGKESFLTLRVWSNPVKIEGENFIVFTIKDIADEKRRESLQRTFFHDVLNEASLLMLHMDNILDGIEAKDEVSLKKIHEVAEIIVDDIKKEKDLLAAEEGSLSVSKQEFLVDDFLNDLINLYSSSKLAEKRSIVLDCRLKGQKITTDRVLLNRVMGNLIKNALEATSEGNTVTVGFENKGGKNIFSVRNPEVMPESVQLQVFQKAFTTKGKGRGIGIYSVKFITETYLDGRVSFVSKEGEGTTFFVEL